MCGGFAGLRPRRSNRGRRRTSEETAGAGGEDFANYLFGIVDGKNEDAGIRIGGEDLPSGIQAVQVRHSDIQQENVRLEFGGKFDGFTTVLGFAANLPSGMVFQHRANSFSGYLVVIRDQDSKHAHASYFQFRQPRILIDALSAESTAVFVNSCADGR